MLRGVGSSSGFVGGLLVCPDVSGSNPTSIV